LNLPAAIADKPALEDFDIYYLNAFYTLSSSRQIGMGEGPIPISEIIEYGKYLEDTDMDMFIKLMRVCDNTYLEERNKEKK